LSAVLRIEHLASLSYYSLAPRPPPTAAAAAAGSYSTCDDIINISGREDREKKLCAIWRGKSLPSLTLGRPTLYAQVHNTIFIIQLLIFIIDRWSEKSRVSQLNKITVVWSRLRNTVFNATTSTTGTVALRLGTYNLYGVCEL